MKLNSPSPYAIENIRTSERVDNLRNLRRDTLRSLVWNEAGGSAELIFPSLRNLDYNDSRRAIEFCGSVFDEAQPVRLLEDELAPHSALIRAGARVLDMGAPCQTQLASIDPSLLAGWQTTPELAAETLLCLLNPCRLSCQITFSKQLLRQQPDLTVPYVERQIYSAIAAEMERAALLGSGADGQPCGLINEPLMETLDLPVGEAAFAECEQLISEGYLEHNIHVLTSPLVRKNMRSLQREPNVWGDPLPRTVSPHLQAAGHNAGEIAVVGSFPDFIIGTWGGIKLQSNPYSRSTEGFISCLAEIYCDVIALRPGSFRVVNPAAIIPA